MPRKNPKNYAGPSSRITLAEALKLGPEWVVQPKIDGQYVEVETDANGVAKRVLSRSGASVSRRIHQLGGERIFGGPATLCGELEAHTEAGNRAASGRPGGRPRLWLFDIVCAGDYRTRRDVLYRGWTQTADTATRGTRDHAGRFRPIGGRSAIVGQRPINALADYYAEVIASGGEGVVLVDVGAALGRPKAKLKLKPIDTCDLPVIEVQSRRVKLRHPDGYTMTVARGKHQPQVGELWELQHEGTYASGPVRFPRLVRRRDDIVALVPRGTPTARRREHGKVLAGPWSAA